MNNGKATYNYGKWPRLWRANAGKAHQSGLLVEGKLVVIDRFRPESARNAAKKSLGPMSGGQLAPLIANLKRLPKRKTMTVPVVRYAKEVA